MIAIERDLSLKQIITICTPATPGGSFYLPPSDDSSSSEEISFDSAPATTKREPKSKTTDPLNDYLRTREISPIRSRLQRPWEEASERTRRYYVRKAGQGLSIVLQAIAPIDSGSLFKAVYSSGVIQRTLQCSGEEATSSSVDKTMMSSTLADHCRSFALSDAKEPSFQAACDHDHSDVCERCATLASTLNDIEEGLLAQSQNMTSNTKEELVFRVKNAKTAILAWKSHLLRSVNQDGARVQLLEVIDESSVLVVQDWAMKYLPRRYRESQTDWFGERGIPWHLTFATRREGGELQMLTFAHIFKSCSQDSSAVLAVMADVIRQLKIVMPGLKIVYYRRLLPLRNHSRLCSSPWP